MNNSGGENANWRELADTRIQALVGDSEDSFSKLQLSPQILDISFQTQMEPAEVSQLVDLLLEHPERKEGAAEEKAGFMVELGSIHPSIADAPDYRRITI